ncbi:MAG: hypothetical protein ABEJ31_07205 [Haloarculaceae archaeon]
MADEFAKGLAILMGGGLGWFVLAGWYNTPSFEGPQLLGPPPESLDVYGQLAMVLKDVLFWFAIVGALTFWIVLPALEEARNAWADR